MFGKRYQCTGAIFRESTDAVKTAHRINTFKLFSAIAAFTGFEM